MNLLNNEIDQPLSESQITSINTEAVLKEINWLIKVLNNRTNYLFNRAEKKELEVDAAKASDFEYPFDKEMPQLDYKDNSYYAQLVRQFNLNSAERLLLITSLASHIAPDIFSEPLRDERTLIKPKHPELGGYFDAVFYNFTPSLKTVLYLIAANELQKTLTYELFFTEQSKLIKEQIITFKGIEGGGETKLQNYVVSLASEYINYLMSGKKPRPDFGKNFPASLITTGLEWDDLVVPESTKKELERISRWNESGSILIEKVGGKFNVSFPCLFYGGSGSGKTLAVQLLGKKLGVDVFRIDLSMVVSKYIGETEKNLSYLFDRAKNKNWILFFDEADALFGKRTDIKDSKDKWANLEMSYLLQRMEEHNGLTILATNFRNNLDAALTRRFQSVIYFAKPEKAEREVLWRKLMPAPYRYHAKANFEKMAHYDFTGGNIINIIKAACLDAESKGTEEVIDKDIEEAIRREFAKENRFPNYPPKS